MVRRLFNKGNGFIDFNQIKITNFEIIVLAVIILFALIIRLDPVINFPERFRFGLGFHNDTDLYHKIAYNLYTGKGFSGTDDGRAFGLEAKTNNLKYEPAVIRGPIYPVFICVVYKILGNKNDMQSLTTWHKNWDKIKIIQSILDSIICLLVFLIVRLIYTPTFWPALFSAFLYCFNFYNIFYTAELLSESVTTFLIAWAILFSILGVKNENFFWYILSGLTFGLVILSRPEYSLFPFIFMSYILFLNRKFFKNSVKKAMLFILSTAIIIAPWALRNYFIFNKPIIVSTGGIGFNLYLGTFESDKVWHRWGNFPDNIFSSPKEKDKVNFMYYVWANLIKQGGIKVEAVDGYFLKLAIGRIRDNPRQCLKNWVLKIPRLWYQNYIQMYPKKEASGNFFIFYFVFGLYAFLKSKIQEKRLMAVVILLFIYLTLFFLPFHVESRYSVPLMPGIIALASIGIWMAIEQLKRIRLVN